MNDQNSLSIKWIIIGLAAIFLFSPKKVFAFSVATPSGIPTQIQIEESFTPNLSISDGALSSYYFIKCRIGEDSTLTQGETYNPITDKWLTDSGSTGAWKDMPVVITDSSGLWQGTVTCRVKTGVNPGQKLLAIRICPQETDGTCTTSKAVQSSTVSFEAVPSPTPTPAPTNTPTPGPTNTPTPTPTLVPPTPTPTKKPTPTPTPSPALTPTGETLGEEATPSAEATSPTPEVLGETKRNPLNLLPKILIGAGVFLLIISGTFLLLPKIRRYNKGENEEIPPLG